MSFSDGVATFQILSELRFIKLTESTRYRLKKLIAAHKVRSLTHEEEVWIRKQYDRRSSQVKQLQEMQQAARETDARRRRGSARDKMVRLRAKRATEKSLRDKRRQLEDEIREIEDSEKDFGI